MLKRYLLFGFNTNYPNGGMDDFIDSFDTLNEVAEEIKKEYIKKDKTFQKDHYQIYDTETKVTFKSEWIENPLDLIKKIAGEDSFSYDEEYYKLEI